MGSYLLTGYNLLEQNTRNQTEEMGFQPQMSSLDGTPTLALGVPASTLPLLTLGFISLEIISLTSTGG